MTDPEGSSLRLVGGAPFHRCPSRRMCLCRALLLWNTFPHVAHFVLYWSTDTISGMSVF